MASEDGPEFCLRWNNHHRALVSVLESLLAKESLVDVILTAEGQSIKVHRLVLFACSQYFTDLLSQQGDKLAVVYLKDVSFNNLKSIVDFMYRGEVCVSHCQLESFLHTAEALKIRGLSDRPTQRTFSQNTVVEESNNKDPVHYNHNEVNDFSGEARHQLTVPRPPRLSRPRPYERPLQMKEAPGSCSFSSNHDTSCGSNLIIDHPDNDEQNSDQDSVKYDEEEPWNRPYNPSNASTPGTASVENINNSTNRDSANESWISEHGAATVHENHYEQMSDSSQGCAGAEGPVTEPAIIESPDGSDRPFVCQRCGRRYKRKNNAVAHLRYECGVVPSFPCPICSHMLSQRRYIQKHIRRKHPDYIQDYQDYKDKKYPPSQEDTEVKSPIPS